MKKPVVVETYDEIVFPEPSAEFFARVQNHPALIVPKIPVAYNVPAGIASYIISQILWYLFNIANCMLAVLRF